MTFLLNYIFHLIVIQNLLISESFEEIINKIYGGRTSAIQERSHFVSLCFKERHTCGTSIIHKEKLLTAAHCFYRTVIHKIQLNLLSLRFNEINFELKDYRTHPSYINIRPDLGYDVAVIFLHLNISNYINGYKIMDLGIFTPSIGTKCMFIGQGRIDSSTYQPVIPKWTQLQIVPWENCIFVGSSSRTKLCTAALPNEMTQACDGDSGSGLVANDKIVGIVSYGPKEQEYNCSAAKYIAFTNVAEFKYWILTVESKSIKISLENKILVVMSILIGKLF